ncbi:MAG: glutathione S-transferase family protein [Gammaproteobacteria bacterium]|nr:glutathione S-transferase family protein [Gammaproteobacteria bacterium]
MDLILHHYDFSNFSEKIRVILGLKDCTWGSVEIPATEPKPDYTPLTGGYRRTPALQCGADVYCDTRLIAEVLEARVPVPSLFPGHSPARTRVLVEGIAAWAEDRLFWPLALYVTGVNAHKFPASFHADRSRLHGKPMPTLAQVEASARYRLSQWRVQLGWIEELLDNAHPYVLGEAVSLADLTLYMAPWFLEQIGGRSALLDTLPRTREWMANIAALGHGHPVPCAAEDALAIAVAAEPQPLVVSDYESPEGLELGTLVTVSPFDDHSAPSHGRLAAIDDERLVIATEHPRTGRLHVHFPRLGYRVRRGRD